MFSRFLNSTITFLTRSRDFANLLSDPEAEQQLQDELARTVSENMFSTRSQDHALPDNDAQGLSINGLPSASKRKRKAERSSDITPTEEATKRRRKESATKATSSVEDCASGNALISPPQLIQAASIIDESQNGGITEQLSSRSEKTSPTVLSTSVPTYSVPVGVVHDNDTVTPKALYRQSKEGKVITKRRKPQSTDRGDDTPTTQSSPNPPKATHKRFGQEDLNPPKTISSSTDMENSPVAVSLEDNSEVRNDADSSDEAPETVTASAGLKQAKAAVSEAAKVAKRQVEVEKQRRKERDARLKEQAKSSKKHRKPPIDKPSDTQSSTSDNPTSDKLITTTNPRNNLPTLLPPALLSVPAPPRLPTPPPVSQTPHQSTLARKLKRQDADSKPAKDITRGPVRVRVLEKENAMLPPKVERRSMDIREGWLKGRGAVVRREMVGGFVRGL